MSAPSAPSGSACRITRVVNMDRWISVGSRGYVAGRGIYARKAMLHSVLSSETSTSGYVFHVPDSSSSTGSQNDDAMVVRALYDKKIGHVGCYWKQPNIPIDFKYADVTFGDLFDFYTSADGVLTLPDWCCLKYAVDQFLAEAPSVKFHPLRVQQFIDENGIDQLEQME